MTEMLTELVEGKVLIPQEFLSGYGDEGQGVGVEWFQVECARLTSLGEGFVEDWKGTEAVVKDSKKKWKRKKVEEVKRLKEYIRMEVIGEDHDVTVVDVGAGMGYLSESLSEECGVTVVAVEAKSRSNNSSSAVIRVTKELTSSMGLELNEIVPDLSSDMVLVGLHCCGDLTPYALKAFVENKRVRTVAVIGCCYHKMKDRVFSSLFGDFVNSLSDPRWIMRLASQTSSTEIEAEVKNVLYRSLIEYGVTIKQLRWGRNKLRRIKDARSFDEYFHTCISRGFIEESENFMYTDLLNWDSSIRTLIKCQRVLRKLCELVITVDRLGYLNDNDKTAKIVRVLPDGVSPRGLNAKSNPLHDLLLQMPTDRAPLLKVLKASRKLKNSMTGGGKYPAGIINLQVLGNGCNHGPKSLYLFTDQARYLFNCGEGTQRLAHEHKMKLGKLEHVFLTNNSWGMIGGLPGVSLTIQDIGIPELSIHGPKGLGSLFLGTRRFVILKDLEIKVVNGDKGGHFEDHVMRIHYVPIFKEHSESDTESIPEVVAEEDDVDYYANYRGMKGQQMVTVADGDGGSGEVEGIGKSCICYICEPKKKEGALLIDKCIERGVPPGPLLGKLKAGEDITLANGVVVKAADVRTPDCPGPTFLLVDCPDESYLSSLLSNEKILACQETSFPYLVVHFTPSAVMLNPLYIEWMGKFRIGTQHLVLNELCNGYGSEAVHRIQTKLGLIDDKIFPKLEETELLQDKRLYELLQGKVSCITFGETLMKYFLRPGTYLNSDGVVSVTPAEYLKETEENEEFKTELDSFRKKRSEQKSDIPDPLDYPKLIFLGTGSSIPNKTRNVSSIMLRIDEEKSIIFDCGEGTLSQLARMYGSDLDKILSTVRVIYISHLHADHHLGLINLLLSKGKKVFLIAPVQIQTWLTLFDRNFEKISHLYELIPITDFKKEFLEKQVDGALMEEMLESVNCSEILTDYVKHCPNAFGVSLRFNFDWKLTYSGDTMPSDNLAKIGKDSDILIHEATMEDELVAEARIKMHSTVSEAVEMGAEMGAKFTILTHFSQRYAKVPLIQGKIDDGQRVGVAFDNMVIRVRKDLDKVGDMYGVLKALFAEDCDEMEERSAKRRRKQEMAKSLVENISSSAVN